MIDSLTQVLYWTIDLLEGFVPLICIGMEG